MATEAKKALRSRIKQKLSAVGNDEVYAQSKRAQEVILSLPEYKAARRVGIYLSMPEGEAQTDLLIQDALSCGKAVFVPHLYSIRKPGTDSPKRKVMDMLRLNSSEEYQALSRDSWGIPTLPSHNLEDRENAMGGKGVVFGADGSEKTSREPASLDVVVMPAVSFDGDMNRLGHGAGFYDRFLARLCRGGGRKTPFLVGLCLVEQLLPAGEKLATQDWDWKVDAVAVGDGRLLTSETIS